MKILVPFLTILFLLSCTKKPLATLGDQEIVLFKNTNLFFDMDFKAHPKKLNDSILRLDAGRVIVKKVSLPKYELHTNATIKMTLTSNGDPWDKSGSFFVIPKESAVTLLDFENKAIALSKEDAYPAIKLDSIEHKLYYPNVELLRFMTPFGVGHFTADERVKDRKPIYIPHWEKEVNWSQDISHLLPLLEEEIYVGVYIDTWTKEGYTITASIDFKETKATNYKKKSLKVIPLINTVKYAADQKLFDGFSKENLTLDFNIDQPVTNGTLYYITTGHGGHSNGDEFVKKENEIFLDGNSILKFTPWRDDCASFRRFNPTSAVWPANKIIPEETSNENIASSDFSRSNWCPGSDVMPEIIKVDHLTTGKHSLTIKIPEAQAATEKENNYWMVSAYLVYELKE